jgi:hypothetical protein
MPEMAGFHSTLDPQSGIQPFTTMSLATIIGCFFLLGALLGEPSAYGMVFPNAPSAALGMQEASPANPEKNGENKLEQTAPSQVEASPAGQTDEPVVTPQNGDSQAAREQNSPAAVNPKPPEPQAKPPARKTAKKKAAHKKKTVHPANAPKAAIPPASDAPSKVVVSNGSTSDPKVQIAPTVPEDQAARDRQNTNQLLAVVEDNLGKLSERQLDTNQQDMVKQIRQYVDQARIANKSGDLQRAQNLASKARMLTDELLKH